MTVESLEMFEIAGPLSPVRIPDVEKNWVVIQANGECNVDVEITGLCCEVQLTRLKEWLDCDLADYRVFSMCDLMGRECAPGFTTTTKNPADRHDCPFAKKTDDVTGKVACCYTVLVNGVTVIDIMEIVQAYVDGEGKSPRRVEAFRTWLRAMMNFYKRIRNEKWKGGA